MSDNIIRSMEQFGKAIDDKEELQAKTESGWQSLSIGVYFGDDLKIMVNQGNVRIKPRPVEVWFLMVDGKPQTWYSTRAEAGLSAGLGGEVVKFVPAEGQE